MAIFKLTKYYNKLAWSKDKKLTLKLLSLILKIYKFAGYQLEIHIISKISGRPVQIFCLEIKPRFSSGGFYQKFQKTQTNSSIQEFKNLLLHN